MTAVIAPSISIAPLKSTFLKALSNSSFPYSFETGKKCFY